MTNQPSNMTVALCDNHYNKEHLEEVKAEMTELGAPTIKEIVE